MRERPLAMWAKSMGHQPNHSNNQRHLLRLFSLFPPNLLTELTKITKTIMKFGAGALVYSNRDHCRISETSDYTSHNVHHGIFFSHYISQEDKAPPISHCQEQPVAVPSHSGQSSKWQKATALLFMEFFFSKKISYHQMYANSHKNLRQYKEHN